MSETTPNNEQMPEEMKQDFFKFKEKYKAQEAELLRLRTEKEELEKSRMVEQNQYKELYERAEQKAKEVESKYSTFQENWKQNEKLNAVKQAALKAGVRQEALGDLELVDVSPVILEEQEGRFKVHGVDMFVDKLKQVRPHWFLDQTPPSFNGSTPRPNFQEKTYTRAELMKLEKENPTAYKEAVRKQYLTRS